MANEIKYNANLNLSNGTLADAYNSSSLTSSQTTKGLIRNVQTISTAFAGEMLDKGSVTTPRMSLFVNLETNPGGNFVEVGVDVSGDFHPFMKLDAGQQAGPMWLGADPKARANTGPVKLFYLMYEE
jgi:hypothetical protein